MATTGTITLRKANDRGHADFGWLDSKHTFSFGEYYNRANMGFRALRVINEDRVQAGGGFPTHGHRDMEIVSYPLAGALEHKDSTGTSSVIEPGDVQRMTAGTGVRHSEFNASKTDPVHFLQIWILPEKNNLPPSYEEKHFDAEDKRGKLRLIASRDGAEGSLIVHQDMRLYATVLGAGDRVTYSPRAGRHLWIQVARGSATVNGQAMIQGDGAAISDASLVEISGAGDGEAELLIFDLA